MTADSTLAKPQRQIPISGENPQPLKKDRTTTLRQAYAGFGRIGRPTASALRFAILQYNFVRFPPAMSYRDALNIENLRRMAEKRLPRVAYDFLAGAARLAPSIRELNADYLWRPDKQGD
jgi:hypothetical protein